MSDFEDRENNEQQPNPIEVAENAKNLADVVKDRKDNSGENADGDKKGESDNSNKSQENPENTTNSSVSENKSDGASPATSNQSSGSKIPDDTESLKAKPVNNTDNSESTSALAGASKNAVQSEQSVSTAHNAATTAAETGKDIGEAASETAASVTEAAAEGAAEGSVVPGAGTVVVAAAKVAWSLKEYIASFLAVLLLILLMPISALQNLGGAIWAEDFDDDGNSVEQYSSVKDIYDELSKVVQDEVNKQYREIVKEAMKKASEAKYSDYPEFNELFTPPQGSAIKNYTSVLTYGYKNYDYDSLTYPLTVDMCKIIATFTVKCQYEGKVPSKEYLKKCLKKADLFNFDTLEMLKFYYYGYNQLSSFAVKNAFPYYEYDSGIWKPNSSYKMIGFLIGEISYSSYQNGVRTLDNNQKLLGGDICSWLAPIYSASNSYPTAYAITENALYKKGNKKIASNNGDFNKKYIEVPNFINPFVYYGIYENSTGDYKVGLHYEESNFSGLGVSSVDDIYTPSFDTTNFYGMGVRLYAKKRMYFQSSSDSGNFEKVENQGHKCVRVTVNPLNETALLDSLGSKDTDWKQEPYPLVADFEVATDSNGNILKDEDEMEYGVLQKNYTPTTFTCAMAISGYEENLRAEIYENESIIKVLDDTTKYTYKSKNGEGVIVYMCADEDCKNPFLVGVTNNSGVAEFITTEGIYYFAEVVDGQRTVMEDGDYTLTAVSNRPVSAQGYISPLQLDSKDDVIKITSFFGYRQSPTSGASTNHGGIDIVLLDKNGNSKTQGCPVYAAMEGTVSEAGFSSSGYGNYVILKHENGTITLYAHLNTILVASGSSVKQGQQIACAGNTGVSTGPHLHFEVRDANNVRQNPLNFLPLNK